MATRSIRTEKPGRLQSMGSQSGYGVLVSYLTHTHTPYMLFCSLAFSGRNMM